MKKITIKVTILFIAIFSSFLFGQSYSGPAQGSVASGVVVTTDDFLAAPLADELLGPKQVKKYMEYDAEPYYGTGDMKVFNNYTYVEDTNANLENANDIGTSFELHSYESIPMTNSIPPDPIVAVGPYNVISMVNGRFHIYDREGNLLKAISDDAWVLQVSNQPGVSDPQVIYDHYEGRWVMVWLTYNDAVQQSSLIVCVSDDEEALGTWYMYATNASVNGTTPSGALGDYPQLGYDDIGIYISTRDFIFGGGLIGAKIRILDKSELYAANGGPLTFTDLWNIRLLSGGITDDLHPTISYDTGNNTAYFVIVPNGGSVFSLYKITDPISNPVLSGIDLGVTSFTIANDAQQLGGGRPLSSGATGSGMRNSPIIRDDSLYAVHHIRNRQDNSSTSIEYFVIDINTESVVHQVEFGLTGFYYIYPSIAVDKDHNVAFTYTRSGFTEYAGSYYATRLATDPQGFSPSKVMVEGKANYDNGSTNRWGDYLGAALDPANQENIWLYSEYAAALNTWGTWLTEIRMKPFTGVHAFLSPKISPFGNVEINTISDTLEVVIANYGTDDLEITSVASEVGPFTRISGTFPQTLSTYDSLSIRVIFSPTTVNDYDEILSITSNDPELTGIQLTGHSYEILLPYTDIFYASSGGGNNGDMITINRETGAGTTLGPSLYGMVASLAVNPKNNVLYGLVTVGGISEIVRVNAGQGDSYTLFTLDIPLLSGIDFDTSGTLYASLQNGDIYMIDLNDGNYTFVTSLPIGLNAIAFNPVTNELWGAVLKTFGLGKDSLYTIDLTHGTVTPVGPTGFGVLTNDMTFDEDNKLYGVVGASNQEGKLFEINQVDGSGTLIGTGIGFNHTEGVAFSINGLINSVDGEESLIPDEYALKQNYPNPFNPVTKIEYSLPIDATVELVVYNILGQQVASLINGQSSAGNHSIYWNADDSKGLKLSSGIYLYMLKATGNDGSEFQQTKKMILIK